MQNSKNKNLLILGNSIKKLRIKHKWKIETLAVRVGVSASTIFRIESGICEPKYLTIKNIASALSMTLSEFFAYIEQNN